LPVAASKADRMPLFDFTSAGELVMSSRASATRTAFRLLPRKPEARITMPTAATGDGIGFIVRPPPCQRSLPVSRS
jgi:hypothetical protein